MSIETSPGSEVSVTGLLKGILADAQDLALRHMALFRSEVMESLQQTRDAIVMLVAGIMVVQIGALFLCQMCVMLLSRFYPTLPVWASYGIVGAILAVLGVWPLLTGINSLRALNPPDGNAKGFPGSKIDER